MLEPFKLLLVEDNPADATFTEIQLKKEFGDLLSLSKCEYFSQCIKEFKATKFDVILLDLCLPDCKGLDTVQTIIHTCQTPIIIYTGISDELIIQDAKKAGIRDYLIKGRTDRAALKSSILNAILGSDEE